VIADSLGRNVNYQEANMQLKVAFVGAGNMTREHIKAFQNISTVHCVGLYSRTRARADALAAEYGISKVFNSVAELYGETSADLVVVSVPELAVRTVCEECFVYPWKMLVEKPAGYNYEDAVAIKDAARRHNSQVWVGLNRRLLSSTLTVQASIDRSSANRFIRVQDQQDQQAALDAGQPNAVVKNWMYANSIHLIDYFRLFGRGEVVEVNRIKAWTPKNPGLVLATVLFSSGDFGLYEGIWKGPGPWGVTVSSEEYRWEMRPLEIATVQHAGERTRTEAAVHSWDKEFKPGFRAQAEEVVAAIAGKPCRVPSIDDALETMALVRRIFEQ
jgi:predicted dehydrogenase